MPDGCWYGCSMACAKAADNFKLKTGPYKGQLVTVDGPEYENAAGLGANCGIFDPEYILEANFYCDTLRCRYHFPLLPLRHLSWSAIEAGIINKEITGGLELTFGNAAATIELLHQMSRGEGFGPDCRTGYPPHQKNIYGKIRS